MLPCRLRTQETPRARSARTFTRGAAPPPQSRTRAHPTTQCHQLHSVDEFSGNLHSCRATAGRRCSKRRAQVGGAWGGYNAEHVGAHKRPHQSTSGGHNRAMSEHIILPLAVHTREATRAHTASTARTRARTRTERTHTHRTNVVTPPPPPPLLAPAAHTGAGRFVLHATNLLTAAGAASAGAAPPRREVCVWQW
jgi:hypothetical protein